MAALDIDLFFYKALKNDSAVMAQTEGRVFNTARKGKEEEEDRIPYVIITNDGATADSEDKDNLISHMDSGSCSIIVVASTREQLSALQKKVVKAIEDAAEDIDYDAMTDWDFSDLTAIPQAGAIQYDELKPCIYRTITYQCDTTPK